MNRDYFERLFLGIWFVSKGSSWIRSSIDLWNLIWSDAKQNNTRKKNAQQNSQNCNEYQKLLLQLNSLLHHISQYQRNPLYLFRPGGRLGLENRTSGTGIGFDDESTSTKGPNSDSMNARVISSGSLVSIWSIPSAKSSSRRKRIYLFRDFHLFRNGCNYSSHRRRADESRLNRRSIRATINESNTTWKLISFSFRFIKRVFTSGSVSE